MLPPHQLFGSPNAAGPAGLEDGVKKLFPTATGAPPPDAAQEGQPVDPYENLDREMLLKRFKDTKADAQDLRWIFERQWWRIILYLLNRQWVFFDARRNEWRDKRLKKWVPKPVTNKLKEVQSSIRAMFASVQMGTITRPNGGDPKNVTTANTVDGLQPLIHKEHKMDQRQRMLDFWSVNLGNAFAYVWWNPDEGEVKPITANQCQGQIYDEMGMPKPCDFVDNPEQPMPAFSCPQCGSQMAAPVKVGDMPTGKGCTDVVSPFELLLPSYATDFDQVDRLIRVRWRTKHYYETHYPELAKTLTWEKQTSERSLNMFKALAAQSSMGSTPFSTSGGAGGQSEGITEYEYWEKPSPAFPRGLFFRVVGEKAEVILEDEQQSMPGPIPVTNTKDEPLWPWVHQSYEPFGGKLWADGAIDSLIQKQDQLNQLDSQTLLSVQRMGNPIWLEPKGTEVEKFTGEPGLVVKYSMVGVSGAKPERIPGEQINASYFTLREQYMRDIEEGAGTYDILKGAKPTGVEAFSALQLLVERSQSRFTEAFAARGEAYRQWFEIALELERKYGPTKRTLSLLGPNNEWTFQTYEQADLQGDVSIVVEDGTNVPKTQLGKRAAMEQANNMHFIDPNDSDTRHAFMSEMGLKHLVPSLDAAKNAALRQQNAFELWCEQGAQGQPPLKIQQWDDADVLLRELKKWANSDRMQQFMNDPAIGELVTMILTQYYIQLATMIQQMQMQQAAMQAGPGAPGGAPGGGQAMARSNANSNAPGTAQPAQHPGAAA